jgi:hypothetical protein
MTSSKSSSSPPNDPHQHGVELFHYQRQHPYSSPPQLTLVDVLAMQAMHTQAQAPPSGVGFPTMPLWTTARGDTVPSSFNEREVLGRGLDAMMALLDGDTIPSGRDEIILGGGRGSADRPKPNSPQNSPPREPSAQ